MSARTVAGYQLPGRSMRSPPVSSRAPALIESCTCSSRSVDAVALRHRPEVGVLLHRVADRQRLHLLHELLRELVGDLLVDDEPLRVDAGLAVVEHPAATPRTVTTASMSSTDGMTMNGSLPPSSRTLVLTFCPARAPTSRPGGLAAGQRHGAHAVVVDDPLDDRRADEQRLERALREARAGEDVLDGHGDLGDVRRVLEQADVARHERRGGEAQHLPVREVPRHDRRGPARAAGSA